VIQRRPILASDWTRVVVDPLGIVGFVLFLVFGLLAKVKARDERRWLSRASIALASVALLGGLSLAFFKATRESRVPAPARPNEQSNSAPGNKPAAAPCESVVVQGDSNRVVPVCNVETGGGSYDKRG